MGERINKISTPVVSVNVSTPAPVTTPAIAGTTLKLHQVALSDLPPERMNPAIRAFRQEAGARKSAAEISTSQGKTDLGAQLSQSFLAAKKRRVLLPRHAALHSAAAKDVSLTNGRSDAGKVRVVHSRQELDQILRAHDAGVVEELTLAGGGFTDEDLRNLPLSVKRLNISGNPHISNAGLANVAHLKLEELSLGGCIGVSNSGLVALKNMPLLRLDLSGCENISDGGMLHLKGLPMEDVDLSWCGRITYKALIPLMDAPIRKLNLLKAKIGDEGMACMRNMPLEELHISSGEAITDHGLRYLKGKALHTFYLQKATQITDAGFAYLSGMPLQFLHLTGCSKMSDDGLAEMVKEMPVRLLYLRGAAFLTDRSAGLFLQMQLDQLYLRDCPGFSEENLAKLMTKFGPLRID